MGTSLLIVFSIDAGELKRKKKWRVVRGELDAEGKWNTDLRRFTLMEEGKDHCY